MATRVFFFLFQTRCFRFFLRRWWTRRWRLVRIRCWNAKWIIWIITKWPGCEWTLRPSWPSTTTSSPEIPESHCPDRLPMNGICISRGCNLLIAGGTCAKSTRIPWFNDPDTSKSSVCNSFLYWQRLAIMLLFTSGSHMLDGFFGGKFKISSFWQII